MNTTHDDSRIYCTQGPHHLPATQKGQLSGLSFVFKDLFDVKGYKTGAGNPAWLDTHPQAQTTSPLILSLLANGAICLGRVQTDELAYSLNGKNCHYGTPVNPVAINCLPGGSSSGSAVAVAKGDVDFAIGTDTGGSVRVPASYCGLYGLRPTLGKLPLEHCFTLAKSFDTAGLLARNIQVLNTVYRSLTKTKTNERPASVIFLDHTVAELMTFERLEQLKHWSFKSGIKLQLINVLAEKGYQLAQLSLWFKQIQGYEIILEHAKWLDLWQHSLDDSIQQRIKWARTITKADYQQTKLQQKAFATWFHQQLDEPNTLWVLPTTPSGPPKLNASESTLAQYRDDLLGLTCLAGLCGLPQLHIPMNNLSIGPCGVSLLGRADCENKLIATAQILAKG